MKTRFVTLVALVMSLFVVGVGCSDDENGIVTPVTIDLGNGALIRITHASPDAGKVDVYARGISTPIIEDFEYGETTPYLDIAPGTYDLELRAANAPATSTPAFEVNGLTIAQDDKITAIAMGLLMDSDPARTFRVIPYFENFDTPSAGNAIARIIHAGSDAPTVSLDVGNDGGTPEVPTFERFKEVVDTGVELPANTEIQIAVKVGSATVTIFTTPQLPAGAELFVIATGLLSELPRDEAGFSLLAVAPTGTVGFVKQNPVVFALHGSPDAGPVDILAGTTELVTDIDFGQLSDALQVPPAAYTLTFRTATGATVAATTPMLDAGERYLAIASGFAGGGTPAFTLLPFADHFDEPNGGAQVRVVHASPDAPDVNVGTLNGNNVDAIPAFSGLKFTDASGATGFELPAANLTIGVSGTTSPTAVASFDVATAPGLRAFAVAIGSFLGNGQTFRLAIVDATNFPWQAQVVLPN
jgi:hypothetical protein